MDTATPARPTHAANAAPDPTEARDLRIVEALQSGLALTRRPFRALAQELGLSERAVVARLAALLERGTLSRFGPMYNIERMGGVYVLAALQVPPARFEAVAAQVNAQPEVAHNYARAHRFNMWFVVAGETAAHAEAACARIERLTGLRVWRFPKEREYFLGLHLDLTGTATAIRPTGGQGDDRPSLDATDRRIVLATQAGLPLDEEPYVVLAARLGLPGGELMQRLTRMLATGVIRRIAAVPNHYALGYRANGMTVWDVDDAAVDRLGAQVAALPFVTHCYRRPRRTPDWPYNLFAMLHGRSQAQVEAGRDVIRTLLGAACRSDAVLYSERILKKTGVRL